MQHLSNFPREVKAEIVLRLPMDEVRSLCQINKDYWSFCNDNSGFWKSLIERDYREAFGGYTDLQSKLEEVFKCTGSNCWNYNTYTTLIEYLPNIVRLRVYLGMNDLDRFFRDRGIKVFKYIAAVLNGRHDIASRFNISEGEKTRIKLLHEFMGGKRNFTLVEATEMLNIAQFADMVNVVGQIISYYDIPKYVIDFFKHVSSPEMKLVLSGKDPERL